MSKGGVYLAAQSSSKSPVVGLLVPAGLPYGKYDKRDKKKIKLKTKKQSNNIIKKTDIKEKNKKLILNKQKKIIINFSKKKKKKKGFG